MSIPFPSLDLIPAFCAVMQQGSLSAAARVLKLAQPTVRRHIEAMEVALGQPLFTRAPNGLTPLPLAHHLLPRALAVLDEAAALARAASGTQDTLAGTVRVTCSRVVATHVMPHALVALRTLAPKITVELAATDHSENLLHRAADIAVRFAPSEQLALVAQRLPEVEIGLFALPSLAAQDADLATLPVILDDSSDQIERWLATTGVPKPQNVVLRCDDPLAQISHIAAGLGAGVCQVKLAKRLGLERLRPDLSYKMPGWLVVHEDQAQIARIRCVFDHLKAVLPKLM